MRGTEVSIHDGAATVTLSGPFEMAATFTVEPALEDVLREPRLEQVTLDLSRVTFIDSIGLGVLARFALEFEARAITLRIVPGPAEVQRVFEMTGLSDALPFVAPDDRKEAGHA